MRLTLGQAAEQAKISKSYLSKLVKQGKISAERQPNGEFRIDPSELDRIPELRSRAHLDIVSRERSDTIENTAWKQERDLFTMLLKDREQSIEDLRRERDEWKNHAQRLLLQAGEKKEDHALEEVRTERDAWRQQAQALLSDKKEEPKKRWWQRKKK